MKIISSKKIKVSKWVSLVSNVVEEKKKQSEYHSIEIHDYVNVLAINKKNEVILVKQFRPAINKKTIELPGGIITNNQSPEIVAKSELLEETGFRVKGRMKKIGRIDVDYGRINNNAYGFFTDNIEFESKFKTEESIETLKLPLKKFIEKVKNNKFCHSPHICFVLLAKLKKFI